MIDSIDEVVGELQKHHEIFETLWYMGVPEFTNDKAIPYGAVAFNRNGGFVRFIINEDFWNKCSREERKFLICHEALHVILNHGKRFQKYSDKIRANKAGDISINHMLVDSFDFDRSKLDFASILCWIDTVFKEPDKIQSQREFEYYYEQMEDDDKVNDDAPGGFDTHTVLDEISDEDMKSIIDDIPLDVLESFGKKAGDGSVEDLIKHRKIKVKKIKGWEGLVQQFTKRGAAQVSDFKTKNRRHSMLSKSFILPNYTSGEKDNKEPDLWFFLDVSHSCDEYKHYFKSAGEVFFGNNLNIKTFTFDTGVRPINLKKDKINGGGGTSFTAINNYIEKNCGNKYPDAVFVFTDGEAERIDPQHPERWHWFLDDRGIDGRISKLCNVHRLRDYAKKV